MDERDEIVQLRTFCQDLGAHVREVQDGASFTAMLWEDADLSLIHISTFLTLAFMFALLSVKQGELPTGSIVVV